jgi:hypothetical protein
MKIEIKNIQKYIFSKIKKQNYFINILKILYLFRNKLRILMFIRIL